MQVNVANIQDLIGGDPLVAGDADFRVIHAQERTTAKGDPKMSLRMEVTCSNGAKGLVFHDIMAHCEFLRKLARDFARCVDLPIKDNLVNFYDDELIGKSGKGTLEEHEFNGRKNWRFKHFYPCAEMQSGHEQATDKICDDFDDDIQF